MLGRFAQTAHPLECRRAIRFAVAALLMVVVVACSSPTAAPTLTATSAQPTGQPVSSPVASSVASPAPSPVASPALPLFGSGASIFDPRSQGLPPSGASIVVRFASELAIGPAQDEQRTFSRSQPYIVQLIEWNSDDVPVGTFIDAQWTSNGRKVAESHQLVSSTFARSSNARMDAPSGGWPLGEINIEIRIGLDRTLTRTIVIADAPGVKRSQISAALISVSDLASLKPGFVMINDLMPGNWDPTDTRVFRNQIRADAIESLALSIGEDDGSTPAGLASGFLDGALAPINGVVPTVAPPPSSLLGPDAVSGAARGTITQGNAAGLDAYIDVVGWRHGKLLVYHGIVSVGTYDPTLITRTSELQEQKLRSAFP